MRIALALFFVLLVGGTACGLGIEDLSFYATFDDGLAAACSAGEGKDSRLGNCWAEAVRYYYEKQRPASLRPTADWYPPSVFFQGMKFMLYGDPSLRLAR